jgi:hypothetical protein
MKDTDINKSFAEIIGQAKTREKRLPAKYPELRYLWGITLLGSFIFIVIASTISGIFAG